MPTLLTPETEKRQIVISGKNVLTRVINDLFSGWVKDPMTEVLELDKVSFRWLGNKIPFVLWEEIVCFLRWSQETHKQEALVTLFYNRETKVWAAEVFPQQPGGMTVRLLPNDPQYATIRAKYGKGWTQLGSIHHHCNMAAFQSGTDKDDESDRDGVHITLGKMHADELDIHIRAVFDHTTYETKIANWVEFPAWAITIPRAYHHAFDPTKLFVLPKGCNFPEDWKARIILHKVDYARNDYGHGTEMEDWGWGAEKKTEGEAASESPQAAGKVGAPGEAIEPVPAGSPEAAAADATLRHKHKLDQHGLDTLKRVHAIIANLGIDFTTTYGLLIEQSADAMKEEDWKLRAALLAELNNHKIHPFYAMSLMERIGVDTLHHDHDL